VITCDDILVAVGPDMTSAPEDPHLWCLEREIVYPPSSSVGLAVRLKAWWVCRRCRTTMRAAAEVRMASTDGGPVSDEELSALRELRGAADSLRSSVHPRCSELRAARDVMTS